MRAPGSQAETCRAHGLCDGKIGAQGLMASFQGSISRAKIDIFVWAPTRESLQSPSSSAKLLGFQGSKEPAFGTLRSCQCTTNLFRGIRRGGALGARAPPHLRKKFRSETSKRGNKVPPTFQLFQRMLTLPLLITLTDMMRCPKRSGPTRQQTQLRSATGKCSQIFMSYCRFAAPSLPQAASVSAVLVH